MLIRPITYENFDGETVTETFHFNLSKSEIIELQVSYKDGLEAALARIVRTSDKKQLVEEFKRIVLLSYGERSDDGKRFIKSDELREAFSQTAAYDTLFVELATDDTAAAEFIKGIIPKDFAKEVDKQEVAVLTTPQL